MKTIFRNIAAVVIGLVLGSLVNMALVGLGPRLIPPPSGVDVSTVEGLAAGVHLLEPKHYLFPFLAHAVGTFVGALVTHLTAATRRSFLAYVLGAFFLTGGIMAAFMIPAPAWFIALDLLVAYIPMVCLARRLGRRIRPEGDIPSR
ncbi:MAG TPA: hypothetical protein VGD88_00620 [Opitutaceae bacterium]